MTPSIQIIHAEALEALKNLPDESVQCCVSSPPYWGLRSYLPQDHPMKGDEIGTERTPEEYVAKMVAVFREVRRVLRKDGTCWLNLGDSYCSTAPGTNGAPLSQQGILAAVRDKTAKSRERKRPLTPNNCKPKDLVGVPWMVAFALRADGWWLRQDIIWAKPNCMPESVEDRCTRSHEYVFLLTKSEKYFFDYSAIMVKASESFTNDSRWKTGSTQTNLKLGYEEAKAQNPKSPHRMFDKQRGHSRRHAGFNDRWDQMEREHQMLTARRRDVWWLSPANSDDAHFAVMPDELVRLCVLAGSSAYGACAECGAPYERVVQTERTFLSGSGRSGNSPEGKNGFALQGGGETKDIRRGPITSSQTIAWERTCEHESDERKACVVLDPFGGSGTTGLVARDLGRSAILIELNPEYIPLIEKRTHVTPGLPL